MTPARFRFRLGDGEVGAAWVDGGGGVLGIKGLGFGGFLQWPAALERRGGDMAAGSTLVAC